MTTINHDPEYSNKTLFSIKNDAARYAWAGYLLLVLISSLVGDTTILIASLKYRVFNLHKVIVVTIQHIAFCDLMVTITGVVPNFVSLLSNGWMFGNYLCYQTTYSLYYFPAANMFLICNMTISKLIILKYPFRYRAASVKKAHMICGACWLAALIIPFIMLLVTILDSEDVYFSYPVYTCNYSFKSDIWNWAKPLLAVLLMFTPNCMVVATTVYLLIIAKQFVRRGRGSLKWQGILTTVLTATVYCISVLPMFVYIVGNAVSVLTVAEQASSFFHTSFLRIANSFLFLNTISNFYIYCLSLHSFRDFLCSRMRLAYQMSTSRGSSASHGKGVAFLSICNV